MKPYHLRRVREIGGASLMVVLPKEYVDALGIEDGDYVSIALEEATKTIAITPVDKK